jgi:DNA-binding transcriptional MerR regulator
MGEVIEILGVSRKTIKGWLGKHVPEPGRGVNGYRSFNDDDIRKLMAYKQKLLATTKYTVGGPR